jgi:hypothetical protein
MRLRRADTAHVAAARGYETIIADEKEFFV